MKIRRISVENVRSFLERTELSIDNDIAIIIGPNGGGKTNLLDTITIILQRHLFASKYPQPQGTPEQPDRHVFTHNDQLNNLVLDKHTAAKDKPQVIDIELEVSEGDISNINRMKRDAAALAEKSKYKYVNSELTSVAGWKVETIFAKQRHVYRVLDGALQQPREPASTLFLNYLRFFDVDQYLRAEYGSDALTLPMVYLPVNRAASSISDTVQLHGFRYSEQKRQVDAATSRSQTPIAALAIGRLAAMFRLLQDNDNVSAKKAFLADKNVVSLAGMLNKLGYSWDLKTVDPLTNSYRVLLKKQDSEFTVASASSGERELLTYLFAVYALNIRDALIVVDEPELHLHPKWQTALLTMFSQLAKETGNQFLLATHSPMFVSPQSIDYVARIYSRKQRSQIVQIKASALPDARHRFNIVNSQNNERIFFADKVILVEGITDRIFFEAVMRRLRKDLGSYRTVEVVSVGGKGFFDAYVSILKAAEVEYALVADRDYLEQVGTPEIKKMFAVNKNGIKDKVIKSVTSRDGETLFRDIELALSSGSWDAARETWQYIKSHRVRLKDDLTSAQQETLRAFVVAKRAQGIHILQRGALESYLPVGHRTKDIDLLVRFLNDGDFWEKLGEAEKAELEDILKSLLDEQ